METISGVHQAAVIEGTHVQLIRDAGGSAPGKALHLGSQDLVRFGAYASGNGWMLASFELADSLLDPVEDRTQEKACAEMLYLFDTYGEAELHAAMQDEFDDLYVVGVEVVQELTGATVKLKRRGLVETTAVPEAEALISVAWRELRLS